jgi:hypothetical protein
MRYGYRTENERINKTVDYYDKIFDHAKMDMKMIRNPKWRGKFHKRGK